MRDLLLTLIVFGLVPVILMRRTWVGVLAWYWIGLMNPHRLNWGFSYYMPFAQVIGLATLVAFLFDREPKRYPVSVASVMLLIMIAWFCLTTLFAIHPESALEHLGKFMKVQLITIITLFVMQSRERIQWLVWTIVVSIGFYGIKGGIFTVITGGSERVWGPPQSTISGNTEIGLALVMTLPLMLYLHSTTENKWIKRGLLAAMVLTAFSVVGTQSRGAFLGGMAIASFLWLKSRHKILTGIGLLACVPVVLLFMPESWWDRMETIKTYKEDASALGRINAWSMAWNLAADRPIVGGGFDAFSPLTFAQYAPIPDDVHDAHSIYFEVLAEHGWVGLLLFVALMLFTWRLGSRIRALTRNRPDLRWAADLGAMTHVSLIGFWVAGAFLGLAYFDGYYLFLCLLMLTYDLVRRETAKAPAALAPPGVAPMPAAEGSTATPAATSTGKP